MFVNNLTDVSESAHAFSLDVFLNLDWMDPRLDHPNFTEEFIVPTK